MAIIIPNDRANTAMISSMKLFQDGKFNSSTLVDIRVADVQNLPPVFQSSLMAIVEEDAPINTHVITVQATDGDRGAPRPIIYDLVTSTYYSSRLFLFTYLFVYF